MNEILLDRVNVFERLPHGNTDLAPEKRLPMPMISNPDLLGRQPVMQLDKYNEISAK